MSSVNITEVTSILITRHNIPKNKAMATIKQLISIVVNYIENQAYIDTDLEKQSLEQKLRLSLGDKACLSFGIGIHLPVCSIF